MKTMIAITNARLVSPPFVSSDVETRPSTSLGTNGDRVVGKWIGEVDVAI
jgi:hypothetical protein